MKKLLEQKLLFRTNPFGFGYEIMSLKPGKPYPKEWESTEKERAENFVPDKRLFYTSSKEQSDAIYNSVLYGWNFDESLLPTPETDFTPKLLVIEEKHGQFYRLIKNEAGYKEAALDIIKQRVKDGHYEFDVSFYEAKLAELSSYSEDEINALPISLQAEAKQQSIKYEKFLEEIKDLRESSKRVAKALLDGAAAIYFLNNSDYNDYGYKVSLERFDAIYD
jgi:hypothetical protein